MHIDYNQYIRTTDAKRHHPGVNALWNALYEKGDIYEHEYKGHYCVGCESFKTEKDLIDILKTMSDSLCEIKSELSEITGAIRESNSLNIEDSEEQE
jgi:methionyl-tRNA synthetase